jgi:tRNA/rRNA methyltransferase
MIDVAISIRANWQNLRTMKASDSIGTDATELAQGCLDRGRVRFVLVEPTHCGNIGAAARAILTMGFCGLCVVEPRDRGYRRADEAVALAANAIQVLQDSQMHATTVEALDGVNLAFAMTTHPREFGPRHLPLRQAALHAASWLQQGSGAVAFVFGTERSGLVNRDVQRCHFSCSIPADPEFGSLNLAQAVQVTAYEMRCALGAPEAARPQKVPQHDRRATIEHSERLFESLERALAAIGFHDPGQPRQLMARLRSVFGRADLTPAEVDILLGICSAMIEPKRSRAGRKRDLPAAEGPTSNLPSPAPRERGRG